MSSNSRGSVAAFGADLRDFLMGSLLSSPRRVAATALALLVLVGLAWQLLGGDENEGPAGQGGNVAEEKPRGEGAAASGTDSVEAPGGGGDHDEANVPSEVEEKIASLGKEFATALLTEAPRGQWLTRIRSLVSPDLGKAFSTVEPTNIPGYGTTPGHVSVQAAGRFGGEATVSTERGFLMVKVAFDGTEWKVTAYTPPAGD